MNCFKKTICVFMALWTPIALAYTNLANSKGEVYSAAPQIAAAILLDENGETRCKVENSEFLSSERFDEFVDRHPETERALDELATLRECDQSDELYAGVVLNPQEVAIAGMPSPARGAWATGLMGRRFYFFIPSLGLSAGVGCRFAIPVSPPIYPVTNSQTLNYALETGVFGFGMGIFATFINGTTYTRVPGSTFYTLFFHTLAATAGHIACGVYKQLEKQSKKSQQ